MNDSIRIFGDYDTLELLGTELEASGAKAEILSTSFNSPGQVALDMLNAVGPTAALGAVVIAFLKNRRCKIEVETGNQIIRVEGKNAPDTIELLKEGRAVLKKLDSDHHKA